jgi:hypothetical protein
VKCTANENSRKDGAFWTTEIGDFWRFAENDVWRNAMTLAKAQQPSRSAIACVTMMGQTR